MCCLRSLRLAFFDFTTDLPGRKFLLGFTRSGGRSLPTLHVTPIRTRIYLRDGNQWEPVSRAHGRAFSSVLPANTLIEAGNLIRDYEVEIEAEAVSN